MKIRTACLLLFLFPFHLAAADKWTTVRTPNFMLVGNATEAQIRATGVELEQFRDVFIQTLGVTSRAATVSTTVVVLKSDDSLRVFNPPAAGAKVPAASGIFQASEDANYMVVKAGEAVPRRVYHQYAHELMRDLPNAIPLWFTEGLAEFFSNFEILTKEKQFALGKPIPEHMDLLKKGPFLSLDDLFTVDRTSPQYNEREIAGVYHAESWALINYLMVGLNATRQADVGTFLKLLISGKPTSESFQTAFKTDTKSMLGELEYYVREKTNWQSRGTTLKEKAAIDKETKVRVLTEAEAEFYSGDLLLHLNSVQDAGTHLQQSIKLDPKLAIAQAAMGMLYVREDRTEEAIDYLKRAVELDPKNYLSQYYYAYVLDKNSNSPLDDLDAKRAALGRSIELMPQYAPAYELLAYINLTADIDYDTTLELLQKANQYASSNQNIRFLYAQTLVKRKELDSAKKMLDVLISETSLETSTRDGVRNLINFIERTRETENKRLTESTEAARREDEAAAAAARKRAETAAQPPPPPAPASETESQAAPRQTTISVSATGSRPKSGELVAVSPQRARPEGSQVKGMLTLVDCRNGLTLTIKSPEETVTLHTDTPDKLQFVSYVASVNKAIACGPTSGAGIPVLVTYRPTPGGAAAGEPLVVEFVEK